MKKRIMVIVLILLVLIGLIVIRLINTSNNNKTNIEFSSSVELIFNYNDKEIKVFLPEAERTQVIEILNNKKLSSNYIIGELSCGFTKDVSFCINGEYYDIACDLCSNVYSETHKKYISITENEMSKIRELFKKYGGYFPCV